MEHHFLKHQFEVMNESMQKEHKLILCCNNILQYFRNDICSHVFTVESSLLNLSELIFEYLSRFSPKMAVLILADE